MKKSSFGCIFLLCVWILVTYHSAVLLWPNVERAIDVYVNETPHANYDYYEDLPSDIIHAKRKGPTVSLLKKLKRAITSSSSSSSSSSLPGSKDFKVVLFWTSWFQKTWWIRFGHGGLDLAAGHCPETRCEFTHDKSRITQASAVLFQSQRIFHEKLPPYRTPEQRWVWVHVEPPTTSLAALATLAPDQGPNLKNERDLSLMFNWTMTYHPASDIMEPYGALLPLQQEPEISQIGSARQGAPSSPKHTQSFEPPSLRPSLVNTDSIAYRRYQKLLRRAPSLKELSESTWEPNLIWDKAKTYSWSFLANGRRRLVAWITSHCSTPSRREDYVSQLHYYVTVDVYGLCGTLKCGSKKDHRDDRCWKQLLARKYLFYLALENSMCDGYITEKVWRPMAYGLVPIVMGGANFSQYLPPHSYINALNYSPEELGQLLLDLQASPDYYIHFHLWRVFWKITLRPPLCELCLKIHNDTNTVVQHDIPGWWKTIGQCKNPAI